MLLALLGTPQLAAAQGAGETGVGDAEPSPRPQPRGSVGAAAAASPGEPEPEMAAASPVALPELVLPGGAHLTLSRDEPAGLYLLPAGPATDAAIPRLTLEGARSRRAWTVPAAAGRLFEDLAGQIAAAGYEIRLRCSTAGCGGFDFRAGLDLLPPPGMYVDLAEFHALTATRPGPDGERGLFLLVSPRGGGSACQLDAVGPPVAGLPRAAPAPTRPSDGAVQPRAPGADNPIAPDDPVTGDAAAPAGALSLGDRLAQDGHVVLDGIRFASGSALLEGAPPPSLTALAQTLRARPDLRVTIVGHSDASGSAAANLALSQRRAEAVAASLSRDLGVPQAQLASAGAGQLAPRASNATPEGRALNRRVEAVLLPD